MSDPDLSPDTETALRALGRAVYFLDRELAPSPKVRAFQRAATVIAGLPGDELIARVSDGTLVDLDGLGPSTARVVTEAFHDVDDGYLAQLEQRSLVEIGPGTDLREALRGDCHMHSTWSDGGAPIATMAATARNLGHEYIVLTDHSARLTIAHGLDEGRLAEQLDEVRALNDDLAPFRILTGMEVDILEDGALDLDEGMLADLDVVVASVHSKLRLPAADMTKRMVTAVASPHVDILGHCTNRKLTGRGRPPSDFDADYVFAACARFGTAVEINCRPERQDPPDDLLALALEWDCHVAIDTDAHAPGQLEWQAYGCDKAAEVGVTVDRVINTWPAEQLLSWVGQ
ncbi:MAG: PHP domain-containing protein [Acidimicrobiia bacterium]|nr:PHP domain-containing protein [Acidimicrobiia bacterium]